MAKERDSSESWFARLGQPSPVPLDDLVQIGTLGRAHGLRGEARCQSMTDFPERFLDTEQVHLHNGQPPVRLVQVESARFQGQKVLLKLRGVSTPEEVARLCHFQVCAGPDELVELEDGEYYHFELEGMDVIDELGQPVGQLREVLENPAHEIYAIDTPTGELLVPAVPVYVLKVDLEAETITIRRPVMEETA